MWSWNFLTQTAKHAHTTCIKHATSMFIVLEKSSQVIYSIKHLYMCKENSSTTYNQISAAAAARRRRVHHPHTINIFTVLQNPSITVLRTYTGSFTLHLNRHTSGVCDGAYFVKRSEEVIRIEVLTKKKKIRDISQKK